MEVKQGFKQTEIGLLPEDWDVKKLGECLIKSPDYGINAAAVAYDDTLPTYLRITDISDNGSYLSQSKVSVNHSLAEHYYLDEGEIVFARTGASVGKTYLYNKMDGKLVFAGFLIRLKPKSDILLPSFLKFITQTKYYWSWVQTNSMRSGQPGLNSDEYKSFQTPLPPLPEQTAIATALSDTDALISGLEKLIEKKRAIKQGAMQQLLKPKEGWEVKRLGDVLKIGHGKNQYEVVDEDGDYPILASGGIIGRANKYLYDKPSVLIGRKGTIDVPQYMDTPFWTIDTLFYTIISEQYEPKFIFYIFNLIDWYSYNEASGVPSLSAKTIENIEINVPKTKAEQTYIAQILSDMDAEISGLEAKLEKYRKVKQGMMQELLTGKTRLI